MGNLRKSDKKQFKKYILWIICVILVAVLAVMPMLAAGNEHSNKPEAAILSGTVEQKNISSNIIGGGQLASEASLNVRIPEHVKLTQYLVGNGDTVSKGDPIAKVDKVSVMTAITEVQKTLDYLSEEIADAAADTTADSVVALAGGTVKVIYAQEGESVQDVMLEHGALAVLSLDDTMSVRIEVESGLEVGDIVYVQFDNLNETQGRVKSNLDHVLTVTVEDDGYSVGSEVTIYGDNGDPMGTGELYISSPWNAIAYSGTVSKIRADEEDDVYVGQTLFTLENSEHTAKYQRLIDQRQEYEQLMQELFEMYRSEVVTAPCDGIITGVNENGAFLLNDGSGYGFVSSLSFVQVQQPNSQQGTAHIVLLSNYQPSESNPVSETQTISIITSELNAGTVGRNYNCGLQASDGVNILSGMWSSDGLPSGLAMEPETGVISGVPEKTGEFTVTVYFAANNMTATKEFLLTVQADTPVLQIKTTSLDAGVVDQPYTYSLEISGSNGGTWTAGNLPAGLVLNEQTGIISGTPTQAGTFTVTIVFKDTATENQVSQEYTLKIVAEESTTYKGYAAQVTELEDGHMKVKQTSYSYTITDLSALPKVTVSNADLTEETEYSSSLIKSDGLNVGDVVLIVVSSKGNLEMISKEAIETASANQNQDGKPSGGSGGGQPGGGYSSGGGMNQAQTFSLYSTEKITVASVTSQEHMTVQITIDELDITQIYIGQQTVVSVDALGGEHFDAVVTEISNNGENEGGNSKFSVELTLEKSGDMLPGMLCSAQITVGTSADAACIPVAALRQDGTDTIVYTSYNEEEGLLGDAVIVTIGKSDGEYVEVIDGLRTGDSYYYAYYDTLTETNNLPAGNVSFDLMGGKYGMK